MWIICFFSKALIGSECEKSNFYFFFAAQLSGHSINTLQLHVKEKTVTALQSNSAL